MALRSRIEPIQKVGKMLSRQEPLILKWIAAKGTISNGLVEGFNGKGRVITKRAYGFRIYRCIEVAL
jgi:transposase